MLEGYVKLDTDEVEFTILTLNYLTYLFKDGKEYLVGHLKAFKKESLMAGVINDVCFEVMPEDNVGFLITGKMAIHSDSEWFKERLYVRPKYEIDL